ncbi:MAG: hypothetical protein QM714_10270 [Nocardioides sp.]|uniref:hypothetical protein n=1 Tax=Nocardioides sp. TaxID=35761 RepID=UPI0039E584C2
MQARAEQFPRAVTDPRVLAAGSICGLGALIAHTSSGGAVPGVSALLVIPMAIVVCAVLVRRSGDAAAVAAAALLSQVCWHAFLMVTAAGAHDAADVSAVRMLATHLLVGALTAVVCLRLDQALLDLLHHWVAARCPLLGAVPTPTSEPLLVHERATSQLAAWCGAPVGVRGPPRR